LPACTSLLLTRRSRQQLGEMRESLSGRAREVAVIEADLCKAADRDRLAAPGRGFAIDLLVNNAGATAFGPVLENGPAAERTTLEANAVAVVDLTARLLPGMIERARRRRAGLINISSMLAFRPTPFLTTYAARNALVLIYSQYEHEAGVGRFGHGRLDRCGLQASQRKPDSQGRAARRGEPARSPIPHRLGAAPSARASRAPNIQLWLG
jgi:NAD(P)-dependent dehydrogenase (short-subunit alcohol dehydrogenase family)